VGLPPSALRTSWQGHSPPSLRGQIAFKSPLISTAIAPDRVSLTVASGGSTRIASPSYRVWTSACGTSVWTGRALRAGFDRSGDYWSRASVFGPLSGACCPWPSWISARIRSHSRQGPKRPDVPPDRGCDGETVQPPGTRGVDTNCSLGGALPFGRYPPGIRHSTRNNDETLS
jgi:hypothetical protein